MSSSGAVVCDLTPGSLAPPNARFLFAEVASALGAVHAAGFAFGDLKPMSAKQNVEQWMTPKDEMPWVRLDDSLEHALGLTKHRIWRQLPVLDHWGQLHSILDLRDAVTSVVGSDGRSFYEGTSAADLLAAKRRRSLLGAEAEAGGERSEGWRSQLESYLLQHARAHTITTRASVVSAAKQMLQERMAFLTVLDATLPSSGKSGGNRVAGIITERSFLHLVSEWEHGERTLDVTTCEKCARPLITSRRP